ncbi:N-acetylmuramic acid 6-phosphate etherase [Luethyella okanaganae]|uniref:N-acetylmuramic acid 6-phosphate etherase n=1 Tax=Luethyella okanaganae TaxID=69372 RepID=A0ABW1VED0_9MICO
MDERSACSASHRERGPELSSRLTEDHRSGSEDIELRPTAELVRIMVEDVSDVASALLSIVPAMVSLIEEVASRMGRGGRLIYVGAGTSGRLAQLDAAECIPTFGLSEGTVVAVLAGGIEAADRADEGAEDDQEAARRRLAQLDLHANDTVIGISASGSTPFVLEAVKVATARGTFTAGITNNPDTPLSRQVQLAVEAPVGAEMLAGSTRLKAGTAQKVILNTLSTVVMMKLGRTYDGYMVGVRSTNKKLIERAQGITQEITGLDAAAALLLLKDSDWNVKAAVLSHFLAVEPLQAHARLADAAGNIHSVLGKVRKEPE